MEKVIKTWGEFSAVERILLMLVEIFTIYGRGITGRKIVLLWGRYGAGVSAPFLSGVIRATSVDVIRIFGIESVFEPLCLIQIELLLSLKG
jgi:hypothetical protein